MPKKLSREEVGDFLNKIGLEPVEQYTGFNDYINIRCLNNHIFRSNLKNVRKTPKCPVCEKIKKDTKIRETVKSSGFKLIRYYTEGKHIKVNVECSKGHINIMNYDNIIKGNKCKVCQHTVLPSMKTMINLINSEGYMLISKEIKSATDKFLIKCSHNHIYEVNWNKFSNGRRCPYCNESKGEKVISGYLDDNNMKYESQYRFNGCKYKKELPFDFYLPEYNICIEYDGVQHFKPVDFAGKGDEWATKQLELNKKRDKVKSNYCKNNSIELIRIPYWEYNNIEEILKNKLNNSK